MSFVLFFSPKALHDEKSKLFKSETSLNSHRKALYKLKSIIQYLSWFII